MVSTKINIIWLIFTIFLQIESNFAKKNDEEKRVNAKKFVEEVNSKNGGKWKAAYNERFALMEEEQKKKLAGAIINSPRQQLNLSILENNGGKRQSWDARRCSTNIQFDARQEWPQCAPIINTIQDQADCASCWAVATASVYSDRHCIEHAKAGLPIQNSPTFHFSSLDLIGCEQNSNGCGGGYPNEAWKWIRRNGICTGTGFKWGEGCKPYPFRPTHRENSKPSYWSPQCQSSCTNGEYGRSYYADKNYPTWIGWLEGNAVSIGNIKEEIRANGSVAAIMDLYNDIYYYNSGVYAHSNNARYEIGHVVRLIGWGTQTCSDGFNTDFWLAMNSWNTDWGEDGVFKIERGTNECGIEQYGLFYGTPEVRTGNENKDGNGQ